MILEQTPGVITDRINVGGNESGQQAAFRGPANSDDEFTFAVDGVIITDPALLGASPARYDFSQFERTAGGDDPSAATGGVTLNVETKGGVSQWRVHGSYDTGGDAGGVPGFEAGADAPDLWIDLRNVDGIYCVDLEHAGIPGPPEGGFPLGIGLDPAPVLPGIEQAGERWSDEIEELVRQHAEGRWTDVARVLAEAGSESR